jgi:Flp pilus assembly protein TadD
MIMPVLYGSILRMTSFLVMATLLATSAPANEVQGNLRNGLGITYAKEGHFEDALRNFSLILAEDATNAAALNNSANI